MKRSRNQIARVVGGWSCLATLIFLSSGCPTEARVLPPEVQKAKSDYEKKLAAVPLPVLVDFGAEWCGPCQSMKPILKTLSSEFADRVVIKTVDVDDSPDLSSAYEIDGIPTFIFFRDGQEVGRLVGAYSKETMAKALNEVLDGTR